MPTPRRKRDTARKVPSKLRPWRAFLMRARNQLLGVVYAADERSAEAAAVAEFKLGDEERKRLIVREQE